MAVVLMTEWDNPTEETRLGEYFNFGSARADPYWQKKVEEGIVKKRSTWSDNTGHLIHWVEFENIDAFAKLWADQEFHRIALEFMPLVNNLRIRLLRPGIYPLSEE